MFLCPVPGVLRNQLGLCKETQQHLLSRFAPVPAVFCRRLLPLWKREGLFHHCGPFPPHSKPAQVVIPNSVYFKNKVVLFSTAPTGIRAAGERDPCSPRGIFHLPGISPCTRVPGGRGRCGTCLHKCLRTDQTLWSRPSPTPGRQNPAQESQENKSWGDLIALFIRSRRSLPSPQGKISHGEAEIFPPGETSASATGSEKAGCEGGEGGRLLDAARAGSAHILGKLARLATPQALFMLRAKRT